MKSRQLQSAEPAPSEDTTPSSTSLKSILQALNGNGTTPSTAGSVSNLKEYLETALSKYKYKLSMRQYSDTYSQLDDIYQNFKDGLTYAQSATESDTENIQPTDIQYQIEAIQKALIFMAIQQNDIETLSSLLITNKNLIDETAPLIQQRDLLTHSSSLNLRDETPPSFFQGDTQEVTPLKYAEMLLENSEKNDIKKRQRTLNCIKDGGINVNNLVGVSWRDFLVTTRWTSENGAYNKCIGFDTNTGRTYHIDHDSGGITLAITCYILTFGLFFAASHILAITLGLHLPLYFFPAATGLLYMGHILSRSIGCLSGIVSHPYRQLTDKTRTYHVSIDKTLTYNACLEILSDCAVLIKSIIVALISPLCFLCIVCPFLTLNGQKWLSRLEHWATSRLTGYPGEPILVGCMGERGWQGSVRDAAQKGFLLCEAASLPPKINDQGISIRHCAMLPTSGHTFRCLAPEPLHPRPITKRLGYSSNTRMRCWAHIIPNPSAAQPDMKT